MHKETSLPAKTHNVPLRRADVIADMILQQDKPLTPIELSAIFHDNGHPPDSSLPGKLRRVMTGTPDVFAQCEYLKFDVRRRKGFDPKAELDIDLLTKLRNCSVRTKRVVAYLQHVGTPMHVEDVATFFMRYGLNRDTTHKHLVKNIRQMASDVPELHYLKPSSIRLSDPEQYSTTSFLPKAMQEGSTFPCSDYLSAHTKPIHGRCDLLFRRDTDGAVMTIVESTTTNGRKGADTWLRFHGCDNPDKHGWILFNTLYLILQQRTNTEQTS